MRVSFVPLNGRWALLLALAAGACSDSARSLVQIDVSLSTGALQMDEVEITAKPTAGTEVVRTFPWSAASNNVLQAGVYLPSSITGDVTVSARGLKASQPVATSETKTVRVSPGKRSDVVALVLNPVSGGTDGGITDAATDRVGSTDGAKETDGTGSADRPGADAPSTEIGPERAPDLAPDAPPDPPSLSNCSEYDHVQTCDRSTGLGDWAIRSVAFSPNGKLLVSGGEDGRAKLWKVTDKGLEAEGRVFTGQGSIQAAFSPDGKLLAMGSEAGQVRLVDLGNSTASKTLTGHTGDIYDLAFSSDGVYLVVGDSEKTVKVWNVSTGKASRTLTFPYNPWSVAAAPVTSSTTLWVAVGLSNGDVTLWDAAAPEPGPRNTFSAVVGDSVDSLAFSPDGTTLAVGGGNGTLQLWNVQNKALPTKKGAQLVSDTSKNVDGIDYAPDGRHFAAAVGGLYTGGQVLLYRVQPPSAVLVQSHTPDSYIPVSVAFSPAGRALAAGEFACGKLLYCRD